MKFSNREDIDAPADVVFATVSDFEGFERMIMRRGGAVQRTDSMSQPGAGMAWDVAFRYRGRNRQAAVTLTDFEMPSLLKAHAKIGGIESKMDITITPLSPNRCRMAVGLDLKPKTLSARLLVQSMKLAKSSLKEKFKARIAAFTADIERTYRTAA